MLKGLLVDKNLKMGDLLPILYVVIALLCTIGSIALAVFGIYRHLLNYTEPVYQRYIVRIIFMVPVSASTRIALIVLLMILLFCRPYNVVFMFISLIL